MEAARAVRRSCIPAVCVATTVPVSCTLSRDLCYRRMPGLRCARSRDRLLSILEETRKRYRFVVVGNVVMPEHIHLLLNEPEVGTPSTMMQVLKKADPIVRSDCHAPFAQKAREGWGTRCVVVIAECWPLALDRPSPLDRTLPAVVASRAKSKHSPFAP